MTNQPGPQWRPPSQPAIPTKANKPWYLRWWAIVGAVILMFALIGLFTDEPEPEAAAPPVSTSAAKREPSARPIETPPASTAADKCFNLPKGVVDDILAGFKDESTKAKGAGAWKSPEYRDVVFVAIRFNTLTDQEDVAVFAVGGIAPDGSHGHTMAVDAFAQGYSNWPAADKSKANISKADRGVKEATTCIQ